MAKQWSKIKNHLENSLCEKLRGRLSYFSTSYRHAHDGEGRVCILVDKKEIINIPFTNKFKIGEEVVLLKETADNDYNMYSYEASERAAHSLTQKGVLTTWAFGDAYDDFNVKTIEECLASDNYITLMIALVDKRTGRRMLDKLKDSANEWPEWLKYFYNLRVSTYR